jgi:hypothetical protein
VREPGTYGLKLKAWGGAGGRGSRSALRALCVCIRAGDSDHNCQKADAAAWRTPMDHRKYVRETIAPGKVGAHRTSVKAITRLRHHSAKHRRYPNNGNGNTLSGISAENGADGVVAFFPVPSARYLQTVRCSW